MKPYVVNQGDHLVNIAFRLGLDAEETWNHPRNAELRARREPNLLAPGDILYVPTSCRQGLAFTQAAGIGTPLRFADGDARLPEQGGGDRVFGQDSWLIGVDFANFADLANKLGGGQLELPSFACKNWISSCGPIEENQIQRLAILAHGGPGGVDIDNTVGRDMDTSVATDTRMLNAGTISKYTAQFDQLMHVLAYRAKVFFMCCLTGAGTEGDDFLKAVSLRWESKEILVVGYKSVLYCGMQNKKGSAGASCYPGARETHYSNNKQGGVPRYYETSDGWNNLSVLPWATESTPHATIAFRGILLKQGIDANPWGAAPST